MKKMANGKTIRAGNAGGFSLVEITVVLLLLMVVLGFSVPKLLTGVHDFRLHGAGYDFSGVAQTSRWRAVQDDRYYSVRFIQQGGELDAYVDIFPQNVNGSSGNGASGPMDPRDPQIAFTAEVSPQAQANAPSTSALKGLFLPSGSPVVPVDGSSSTTPITFGPRGLPCVATTTNGGSVCDSAGGLQAYWVFLQDSATQMWEAVTITPVGRIQIWEYRGSWTVIQM